MTFDGWDHLLRLEIEKESAEPYIYIYLHSTVVVFLLIS
jgi:hypothetical protein